MNKNCPTGREHSPTHTTCRTCPISCSQRLAGRQKAHVSKYGAHKTVVDGVIFDSKREAARYSVLKMMERAGEITNLKLQPEFEIVPRVGKFRAKRYIADFSYTDKDGNYVVEDAKGVRTPTYRLKAHLLKERHGIDIVEV